MTRPIYCCSTDGFYPTLRDLPACNTPKQCNWWGRDLFVDDPDLAKERLLFLNSGAFAFTSRRFFKPIGEQVYELYLKDRRFDSFGADQGFFNYVEKTKSSAQINDREQFRKEAPCDGQAYVHS